MAKQAGRPVPSVYREDVGEELDSEQVMQALEAASVEELQWAKDVLDRTQEADRLASLGEFSSALGAYEEILVDAPFDPILSMSLASCHAELGDHEKALEYAEAAHRLDPGSERIRANLRQIRAMPGGHRADDPESAGPRSSPGRDAVSEEDSREMAAMLANARRMAEDARRRYEQAVDAFEAVHGGGAVEPSEASPGYIYLCGSRGEKFSGSPDDGIGSHQNLTHSCPLCGGRASEARSLWFYIDQCLDKGAARFACQRCERPLVVDRSIFTEAGFDDLRQRWNGSCVDKEELLSKMTRRELFAEDWLGALEGANTGR